MGGPEESRVSTEIWATRGPRGWRRGPFIGLSAGRKKTGAGIRIFCKVCKNWLHFEEDELRGLTFAKCIPQKWVKFCNVDGNLFTNEL